MICFECCERFPQLWWPPLRLQWKGIDWHQWREASLINFRCQGYSTRLDKDKSNTCLVSFSPILIPSSLSSCDMRWSHRGHNGQTSAASLRLPAAVVQALQAPPWRNEPRQTWDHLHSQWCSPMVMKDLGSGHQATGQKHLDDNYSPHPPPHHHHPYDSFLHIIILKAVLIQIKLG